ncbi:MAG: nucleotidyltransferase domain-containing protein [Nanoarchaeota archaeon]
MEHQNIYIMYILTYHHGDINMIGNEVEFIRLLIENKDKDLSISSVAKLLKKDYKNAHNIVKRLEKRSLISLKPFGRSYRLTLNIKPHPLIFEAEHERRSELLKNKDLVVMLETFKGLRTKLFVLLVFGSHAKKTSTKHSDIDLLFIVPDAGEERIEKEIQNIASILPLKLHLNIFSETDFKAMKNSKETTVGSEAIMHNVILHGIEPYYEIVG